MLRRLFLLSVISSGPDFPRSSWLVLFGLAVGMYVLIRLCRGLRGMIRYILRGH